MLDPQVWWNGALGFSGMVWCGATSPTQLARWVSPTSAAVKLGENGQPSRYLWQGGVGETVGCVRAEALVLHVAGVVLLFGASLWWSSDWSMCIELSRPV